ncbi:hypothetical protein N9C37_04665 [Planktomarina temperata]|nr:hypothetical protein [Planktomarina temperata]
MRHVALLLCIILPDVIVADQLTISVPSAVANTIREYRAECTDEGGALELDGDEISKLRTDEGEEAYVIYAAFTCGDLGHLWCGAMGCPTDLVINNRFYSTNRILQKHPTRISKASDGTVTYWMPDGLKLMIER